MLTLNTRDQLKGVLYLFLSNKRTPVNEMFSHYNNIKHDTYHLPIEMMHQIKAGTHVMAKSCINHYTIRLI